uniref:Uncharacterized protein n=1 Tax=Sarcophilus harrisii TaxID=9305 RepID=A0A7N4NHB0_SARHA
MPRPRAALRAPGSPRAPPRPVSVLLAPQRGPLPPALGAGICARALAARSFRRRRRQPRGPPCCPSGGRRGSPCGCSSGGRSRARGREPGRGAGAGEMGLGSAPGPGSGQARSRSSTRKSTTRPRTSRSSALGTAPWASPNFWDTAGQERFQSMHASYYHKAHACIMVFDVQRKVTYKNLSNCSEFRVPPDLLCGWPMIDGEGLVEGGEAGGRLGLHPLLPLLALTLSPSAADTKVTQKSFNFARKFSLPLYFVSAANGTNVVKVFNDTIRLAVSYKQNSQDFMDEILQELENFELEKKAGSLSDSEPSEASLNLPSP